MILEHLVKKISVKTKITKSHLISVRLRQRALLTAPLQSLTVPVSLGLLLRLPWLWQSRGAAFQLFQLLDQQAQMLQQVSVLQQQLVDSRLSLHASGRLSGHLIL